MTEFIQSIYLFFILAGMVMIVILFYLRYLTNRALNVMLKMIEANKNCNYDMARFLSEAGELIKTAEVGDMFYDISYGESSLSKSGTPGKKTITREATRPDYSIHLGIVPVNPRGYQEFVYKIIFETLFLLVEMDILMKIKVANEALYNFSKLQTFLLHDVKNVTQFIKGLLYNVGKIKGADREHKLIEYLRESAPSLAARTDKILGTLEIGIAGERDVWGRQEIEIAGLIRELFLFYGVKGETTGCGMIKAERHLLATIFGNILKNVQEKSVKEQDLECFAFVREEDEAVTVLIYDTGSPVAEIERMFEPFYTTKKTGLGIGLFQARHIIKNLGGTMTVANTERGVEFNMTLMKTAAPSTTAEGHTY